MTIIRTYDQECNYLTKRSSVIWDIKRGFVENMNVPGVFFASELLIPALMTELQKYSSHKPHTGGGGFLPALKQVGNVAALPGIVKYSIGLPDIHAGYGFAIGNVAACETSNRFLYC